MSSFCHRLDSRRQRTHCWKFSGKIHTQLSSRCPYNHSMLPRNGQGHKFFAAGGVHSLGWFRVQLSHHMAGVHTATDAVPLPLPVSSLADSTTQHFFRPVCTVLRAPSPKNARWKEREARHHRKKELVRCENARSVHRGSDSPQSAAGDGNSDAPAR